MRLFFLLFLFSTISFSQDYTPKRYHNPENKIETKVRDNNKLKNLFNSVLLKRSQIKDHCNCPDDKSKVNFRTNKFNLTNSINRAFSNLIRSSSNISSSSNASLTLTARDLVTHELKLNPGHQ